MRAILHIPHFSTRIPLMEGFLVEREMLEGEMLKLTDWYTHELFYSDEDHMIVADFSRIFCDVERFAEDSQEVMAQYGMGVLYENNDNGQIIRKATPRLKEEILKEFYWRHHQKFCAAVDCELDQFGKALIIDCHSFPDQPLKRDLDQKPNRPDFNIGTDTFHTPEEMVDLSIEFFEKSGFSLGINWPYQGSIVPLKHYGKNKNVQSIMLEINRGLYLKGQTNEKMAGFDDIQKVVKAFIQMIKGNF